MLASRTAEVSAELQKLKALYTSLWRARTRSATDPFEDGLTPEEESGPLDGLKELSTQ
jgi:nucleoporin p58/p45